MGFTNCYYGGSGNYLPRKRTPRSWPRSISTSASTPLAGATKQSMPSPLKKGWTSRLSSKFRGGRASRSGCAICVFVPSQPSSANQWLRGSTSTCPTSTSKTSSTTWSLQLLRQTNGKTCPSRWKQRTRSSVFLKQSVSISLALHRSTTRKWCITATESNWKSKASCSATWTPHFANTPTWWNSISVRSFQWATISSLHSTHQCGRAVHSFMFHQASNARQ